MKTTIIDGYAPHAKPHRGYHAYRCTITFEPVDGAVGSDEEMRQTVEFFHRKYRESNMWMWLHEPTMSPRDSSLREWEGQYVWSFDYGFDSGD